VVKHANTAELRVVAAAILAVAADAVLVAHHLPNLAPKVREVGVVDSLPSAVRDARARATGVSVSRAHLPHGVSYVSPLFFAHFPLRALRLQDAFLRDNCAHAREPVR
jgi:hypothetical protein